MTSNHLIIDGYCLLHRDPELRPLLRNRIDHARHRLVQKVARVCDALADHTTIVFDGRSRGRDEALSVGSIEVMFSHSDQTADTVIERMTASSLRPERIRVVTSDRAEIAVVTAAGAEAMSCAEFLDRCAEVERRAGQHIRYGNRRGRANRLGDHFPADQ